jgi:hypothetical protein
MVRIPPAAATVETGRGFVTRPRLARSPDRAAVRAGVERLHNGYRVAGVATVEAWPHRPMAHALGIARRLVRDAAGYLAVIRDYAVPGVVDDTSAAAAEEVRHVA